MSKLPLPSARQEEWADCEVGVIIHHCMETYHPEIPLNLIKVSAGKMPAASFAPTDENTDQWLAAAAEMGAKYAVFVANHVTGFSMWPTKYDDYSIAHSPYKNGGADIVKDFVSSCKKYGIRPGLYYSTGCNAYHEINDEVTHDYKAPYYRNYVRCVENQLTELWSEYGDLFEIWFDGGIVPSHKGGPDILGLLEKYQPNAVCFQGPSGHSHNLRWVGNENGNAPMDCWSTVTADTCGFDDDGTPDEIGKGNPNGGHWIPAETDMGNRKPEAFGGGWGWAANEDHLVYTAEELMEKYMTSVGRNSNLLLGMAISQSGLFDAQDTKEFKRFGGLVRRLYADPAGSVRGPGAEFELNFDTAQPIRILSICEDIHYGQRIRAFHVDIDTPEGAERLFEAKSVGHKRLIPVNRNVKAIRFTVDACADTPILKNITAYR